MGAEDGQVGVVTFQLLVAVAVDHRQIVVVVLLADKAPGVLAEGAHLVLEGPGMPHQLRLVEDPVHRLHDLAAHLHPHADVHRARLVGDVVLGAQALQPVGPPAARGNHRMAGQNLLLPAVLAHLHPPAHVPLQNKIGTLAAEEQLHAVLQQVLFNGVVEVLGLLRAQVADGAVHQLQPRPDGPPADGLDLLRVAQALHVAVRAELQVDAVGVVDGLLGLVRTNEAGQIAPHLAAEGQLAVGEGPGPGEAGGNVAVGLAAHALARLALGTAAVLHRPALLHNENPLPAALFQHLQGCEDAGGPCADDDNVSVHGNLLFLSRRLLLQPLYLSRSALSRGPDRLRRLSSLSAFSLVFFTQIPDDLENVAGLTGGEPPDLPRQVPGALGRERPGVKKIPGRDVEVFADIEESGHGRQRPPILDFVDVALALAQGQAHVPGRHALLRPQLGDPLRYPR